MKDIIVHCDKCLCTQVYKGQRYCFFCKQVMDSFYIAKQLLDSRDKEFAEQFKEGGKLPPPFKDKP
jgi:hypothetical protein